MHPALLIAFAAALPAVSTLAAADLAPLRQALTFHAAFDGKFDADFSHGDRTLYFTGGGTSGPAKETDTIKLVADGGRFGGALHITKKNPVRPYFKGPGAIDYKAANWSGSVSVWLRLTPEASCTAI